MAINFDGSSDYISAVENGSLDIAPNDITLAAWVYPEDTPGTNDQDGIISKRGNSSQTNYQLLHGTWAGTDRKVVFSFRNAGWFGADSTNEIALDTWSHIAATYDGANVRLYINGVKDGGDQAETTDLLVDDQNVLLGSMMTTGNRFLGSIEDACVYDTTLTDAQIAVLASSRVKRMPLIVQQANLKAYWPMDEDSAGTAVPATSQYVQDFSGNGNNGTKVGGPDYTEGYVSYPAWPLVISAIAPTGTTWPLTTSDSLQERLQ